MSKRTLCDRHVRARERGAAISVALWSRFLRRREYAVQVLDAVFVACALRERDACFPVRSFVSTARFLREDWGGRIPSLHARLVDLRVLLVVARTAPLRYRHCGENARMRHVLQAK